MIEFLNIRPQLQLLLLLLLLLLKMYLFK